MFSKLVKISNLSALFSIKFTVTSVSSFSLKSFSIVFLQISRHSVIVLPNFVILKEFKYNFKDLDSTRNSLVQLYLSFINRVTGIPFSVIAENS